MMLQICGTVLLVCCMVCGVALYRMRMEDRRSKQAAWDRLAAERRREREEQEQLGWRRIDSEKNAQILQLQRENDALRKQIALKDQCLRMKIRTL